MAARLRALWLRRSLPFRFAHKPLCERFAPDVIRIGAVRACRSCTLLYASLVAAAAVMVLAKPEAIAPYVVVLAATLALSAPRLYKRWPRPARDALRASAGALLPWTAYFAWVAPPVGVAGAITLFVFWRIYLTRRADRKAQACAGCPELGTGVCSGFSRQAEAALAYEDEASELVMASGFVPSLRPRKRSY